MQSSKSEEGEKEGTEEGEKEGTEVGEVDGTIVGDEVGVAEGINVGLDVGLRVERGLERHLPDSITQGSAFLHVFFFVISSQTPRNKEQAFALTPK